MTSEELRSRAVVAPWCSALGTGPANGAVHIEGDEQWHALIRECTAGAFDLTLDEDPSGVPDFTWLSEDEDVDLTVTDAEIEIKKAVLLSTQHVSSPWLKNGHSDLTPAFRRAAAHCFAAAAREGAAGRPGVWTMAVDFYVAGRWPFGITDDGRILVL